MHIITKGLGSIDASASPLIAVISAKQDTRHQVQFMEMRKLRIMELP